MLLGANSKQCSELSSTHAEAAFSKSPVTAHSPTGGPLPERLRAAFIIAGSCQAGLESKLDAAGSPAIYYMQAAQVHADLPSSCVVEQ